MYILVIGGDEIAPRKTALKNLGCERITHWSGRKESINHRDAAFWLRDIHDATGFVCTNFRGSADWNGASAVFNGVRAFFLIG